MKRSSSLTPLEVAFLDVERKNVPMHISALVEIEPDDERPPITIRDLRRHLAARIKWLPRFQQRIEIDPLGLWPRWTEPEPVDIDAHLFHHGLPSEADQAAVARLCAELHADPLPRHRPLWEIHLIDAGGRQAILVKLHHVIADGIGGVQIAQTLFDLIGPRDRSARPAGARPMCEPAPWLIRAGQALVGGAFLIAGGPIARTSPFNLVVGRERSVGFATLPMERLVELKGSIGGSIDDVMLAVVALALRNTNHSGSDARPLRAMVPVSTWTAGGAGAGGNHVSAIFVDLPQHTGDLGEIVASVSASKSVLRGAHAAAAMSVGVSSIGVLPGPLRRTAVRIATALPFANVVVSDTPGPEEGLALLGRRISACYPLIPLPATVGLSIAALSLGGVMGVGIVADPRAVAEPGRLASAIERAVRRPASRRRRSPIRAQAA